MAGDWIKMRGNLWDDPRVAAICDDTDSTEAAVVGALYWLWASADQHTEDGAMPGLSLRQIDRKTGLAGFGESVVRVGWLEEVESGVRIIRFEEHNGASAKRRCTEAKRKATGRNLSATDADKERTESGSDAELEIEIEKEEEQKNSPSIDDAPRRQQVPTQDVIDAYNATMTRLAKVRALTSKRKRAIEAAWKSSPLAGDVELFREYFEECETDAFLSGVGPYGNGHENWRPDFDYLMRPDVIAKTYEKAMDAIERDARQ